MRVSRENSVYACAVHIYKHTYTFIKELFPYFSHTLNKPRRAQSKQPTTNLSRQQRIQFCALPRLGQTRRPVQLKLALSFFGVMLGAWHGRQAELA